MLLCRIATAFGKQEIHVSRYLGNVTRACSKKKPRIGSRSQGVLLASRVTSSASTPPRQSLREILAGVPPVYPHDLVQAIRRDEAAVERVLVVLDDDPTGTQTVHSVPVLAEWSVDTLIEELRSAGKYRVVYLNTNARALAPTDAFAQYEQIARNLKEASLATGFEVTIVSRGDSTLRGHFPGDLLALEQGMEVRYDAWVFVPFFQAGGRLTVGDVHYVNQGQKGGGVHPEGDPSLIPVGDTEFARDPAFGYRSSNLVHWIKEKCAGVDDGHASIVTEKVTSISLHDLREGGPAAVRARLANARGGCVVVNAVERRDLEVFVKGLLEEELQGRRFLFRTAADFVAIRGAVDPRPLLEREDFDTRSIRTTTEASQGGLTVVGAKFGGKGYNAVDDLSKAVEAMEEAYVAETPERVWQSLLQTSYVAKSTEQLEYALATIDAAGVELRAEKLIGEGTHGTAAFDREVARVRARISLELSRGRDVILYTSRGVPLQADGAGGLVFGEHVGSALVACVGGVKERPRFLVSKGGITSSDVATKALGMTRAEVMGQILPGVPVWLMPQDSRWPGLPLVVFPGNVGGKKALVEAMIKLGARKKSDRDQDGSSSRDSNKIASARGEVFYPYASGSGLRNRTLDILGKARERRAAVGAFTVYSLEGIRAVVEAAEVTGRSAILQAHPAALGFQRGVPLLSAAVNAARACSAAGGPPLSVQLDHGTSEEHVVAALEAGVDSVMVDGSMMSYEENVAWTAVMAAKAHASGVAVEAELGRLAGEEDGMSVSDVEARMTDPLKVPEFLENTKADVLAVTVGNVHGRYANPDPRLDFPRLELIADAAAARTNPPSAKASDSGTKDVNHTQDVLLAMHGASGLPSSQVQGSIALGVCKFNVNTEVRAVAVQHLTTAGTMEGSESSKKIDLLGLLDGSMEAMRAVIEQKMLEFDPR